MIDAIRSKRAAVVIAALTVTAGSLVLPMLSGLFAIALSQVAVSAVSSIFGPAIAAISLGVVGHAHFAARTGRNEAFNHAGNAFAAALAGSAAHWWGPAVVFGLIAATARIGVACERHRSRSRARLARRRHPARATFRSQRAVVRPLLFFAASVLLFHFVNAAMLPLVGQKLALQDKNLGTSLMSACIVAAQIIMVPMAILVGYKANHWGRRPPFRE